jgi:hypothetical protein
MEDTGVILNFYKQLNSENQDKSKVMKSFLLYILDKKPESKEYALLNKIIKDFGYDISFEALVAVRYSNEFSWGYVIAVCKNLLKQSIKEDSNDEDIRKTEAILLNIKSGLKGATK